MQEPRFPKSHAASQQETRHGSSLKLECFQSDPICLLSLSAHHHPSFPCQLSLSHICLVGVKHQSQPLGLCSCKSLFPTPGHAPPIVLSRLCSKVTKEALPPPSTNAAVCPHYRLLPNDTCDRPCLFAMPTRISAPWRLQLHSALSITIPQHPPNRAQQILGKPFRVCRWESKICGTASRTHKPQLAVCDANF